MNASIISAYIALVGVIVSVVASVGLALLTIQSKSQRARHQLTSTYAEKLLDARIAVYPELYARLSHFIKHIEGGTPSHIAGHQPTVSDTNDLLTGLVTWDTKHALLLSDRSVRAIYSLRQDLIAFVKSNRVMASTIPSESQKALCFAAQQVEIALKADLGIYEVEIYERRVFPPSYRYSSELVDHGHRTLIREA